MPSPGRLRWRAGAAREKLPAFKEVKPEQKLLFVIACLGFISLGLPDTVIGVAWPSVRSAFGREQGDVALVFIGGGISYFLSSFFTGRLMNVFSIGTLLAVSSAAVAASAIGFGSAPAWLVFAPFAILHGLGSGAIDAGMNHYVASHFSAREMNWLHACYSAGATLGPVVMTAVLAAHASWRVGYLVVASMLLPLAFLFTVTRRRWSDPGSEEAKASAPVGEPGASMGEALRHPAVRLQILFFCLYAGLEVTVGQWSFTILTESRGMAAARAGLWVTAYWGSIAAGRIVFGFVVNHLGIDRVLRLGILSAFAGALVFAADVPFSEWALPLIGLSLAPLYPCMMTKTPQRLGKALSAHAIGFQVSAAMLGIAAVPSLSGWLAERFSLATIGFVAVSLAGGLVVLNEWLSRNADRNVLGHAPRSE